MSKVKPPTVEQYSRLENVLLDYAIDQYTLSESRGGDFKSAIRRSKYTHFIPWWHFWRGRKAGQVITDPVTVRKTLGRFVKTHGKGEYIQTLNYFLSILEEIDKEQKTRCSEILRRDFQLGVLYPQ